MKEKWLSVQKDCKFKYYVNYKECCTLHHHGIPCNIENCQIFKFAEVLFQPEPEPTRLPTLHEFWNKAMGAVREVNTEGLIMVGDKKVGFWYNDNHKLKIKKCEYIEDILVYHLEDY